MEKFSLSKMVWIVFAFCAVTAIASPAQTFTSLYTFCSQAECTDGIHPHAGLVQGTDGNFYGTTYLDGANCAYEGGCGTLFKITPNGTLTTLHQFCSQPKCADGANPWAGLVQGTDGNFYGTTREESLGGAYYGTVFKITPGGTLTTLHTFCSSGGGCPDGTFPYAGLVQGTDGNFYGTTEDGGDGEYYRNVGTVFKISPAGKLTTLHSFCSQPSCADGAYPEGELVQGNDGNFYGTTIAGKATENCAEGCGTVFKITPGGKLTTLYTFCSKTNCADGASPVAGLVQGTDGDFYGTATGGGVNGYGTVFKITPTGTLTTLHSFDGKDGFNLQGVLTQATDGNFYGTTYYGGNPGDGTVFKMTPGGTLTTIYNFSDNPGGGNPGAGLVQGTDGNFYGTAYNGGQGTENYGTVFRLSLGLGPFVETKPTFGKEGAPIVILGTNLTGATKVSFNGTAAKFTVVSSAEITTTVPASAKTGTLEVTTAKETLKSNLIFKVTPQLTSFAPTSGVVGTSVKITGTELTQTSEVTFDGVKATDLKVVSNSEVTADVPTGAKTGKVTITTPGGAATSATTFTVTP